MGISQARCIDKRRLIYGWFRSTVDVYVLGPEDEMSVTDIEGLRLKTLNT